MAVQGEREGALSILPVTGIGDVLPGDDVADVIVSGLGSSGIELQSGDVVVVTHKIVSKAEGRVVAVADDAEYRRLVLSQAAEVIRRRGDLVITKTEHGFICANAGVDRSNTADGSALLLPTDPDRSAHTIRIRLERHAGARLAVVVSDTFGRPWRRGLTDVAIGVSGLEALIDLKGTSDMYGRTLDVTEVAIVDELASAADLVMGKASGIPVAIVRGGDFGPGEGRATDLVRPADEDLFR
ncbi:MAG: coenzyme F420-0:L-glutamate ligase [Acidimicrobiia bacterium]